MARKIVEIPDASRSGGSITRQTDTGTGGKTTQSGAYMRTATPRTTSMNRTATPRTTSMNRTATPRTQTESYMRTQAQNPNSTGSYKRTQTPLKKKVK